eukprot:TRINITY_DN9057_c0_g1_i2.p1 TRINITY_DN9057_c0_g1~~TRINITY_DN9057_c0_g1_i2.p1  ORF type:complete len:1011 (-),score=231.18 TRINITY_DN9057_c0_g1_i2:663-3695(-)
MQESEFESDFRFDSSCEYTKLCQNAISQLGLEGFVKIKSASCFGQCCTYSSTVPPSPAIQAKGVPIEYVRFPTQIRVRSSGKKQFTTFLSVSREICAKLVETHFSTTLRGFGTITVAALAFNCEHVSLEDGSSVKIILELKHSDEGQEGANTEIGGEFATVVAVYVKVATGQGAFDHNLPSVFNSLSLGRAPKTPYAARHEEAVSLTPNAAAADIADSVLETPVLTVAPARLGPTPARRLPVQEAAEGTAPVTELNTPSTTIITGSGLPALIGAIGAKQLATPLAFTPFKYDVTPSARSVRAALDFDASPESASEPLEPRPHPQDGELSPESEVVQSLCAKILAGGNLNSDHAEDYVSVLPSPVRCQLAHQIVESADQTSGVRLAKMLLAAGEDAEMSEIIMAESALPSFARALLYGASATADEVVLRALKHICENSLAALTIVAQSQDTVAGVVATMMRRFVDCDAVVSACVVLYKCLLANPRLSEQLLRTPCVSIIVNILYEHQTHAGAVLGVHCCFRELLRSAAGCQQAMDTFDAVKLILEVYVNHPIAERSLVVQNLTLLAHNQDALQSLVKLCATNLVSEQVRLYPAEDFCEVAAEFLAFMANERPDSVLNATAMLMVSVMQKRVTSPNTAKAVCKMLLCLVNQKERFALVDECRGANLFELLVHALSLHKDTVAVSFHIMNLIQALLREGGCDASHTAAVARIAPLVMQIVGVVDGGPALKEVAAWVLFEIGRLSVTLILPQEWKRLSRFVWEQLCTAIDNVALVIVLCKLIPLIAHASSFLLAWMLQSGILQVFQDLLADYPDQRAMIARVVAAVRAFLIKNPEAVALIIESGITAEIIKALDRFPQNSAIVAESFILFLDLARTPENALYLLNQGVWEVFVPALRLQRSVERIAQPMLALFARLACQHTNSSGLVEVTMEHLGLIADCMFKHSTNMKIQSYCIGLLHLMTRSPCVDLERFIVASDLCWLVMRALMTFSSLLGGSASRFLGELVTGDRKGLHL